MKSHLNVTYNDVKENEEPNVQSEVVNHEEPPVKPANEENSEKVDEHPCFLARMMRLMKVTTSVLKMKVTWNLSWDPQSSL